MKNNRKVVEARQQNILELVREKNSVSVEDLAKEYNISLMTVRRDLQYLEEQKLLHRTHGGAVSLKFFSERERSLDSVNSEIIQARTSLSEFAASLVESGDHLFINGSRTALDLLKYVGDKSVSVFTNNGWAVGEEYPKGVTLCFSGGEIRGHIMVGELVMKNLLEMKADKAFLGCAAVYDDGEFQYDIPTEIGIHEAMISRTSGSLYILADYTKLHKREERENTYGSCIYDRPCTLITDSRADKDIVAKLSRVGVKVIFAK